MKADYWLIAADCLLKNGSACPDAVRFIHSLVRSGTSFAILTNRSDRSQEIWCTRFQEAGFKDVVPSMFYTSIMAAIDYAYHIDPKRKTAGYIGNEHVRSLLKQAGYAVDLDHADWLFAADDRGAEYNDYSYALRLLEGGAMMLASDNAVTYTTKNGSVLGVGSVVKMLGYASGKEAVFTGFPSPIIVDCALRYLGGTAAEALLVGCDLAGDIKAGNAAGITTVYILPEGEGNEAIFDIEEKPSFMIESLGGLLR